MTGIELALGQVRVTGLHQQRPRLRAERELEPLLGGHGYALIDVVDGVARVIVDGKPEVTIGEGVAVLVCSGIVDRHDVRLAPVAPKDGMSAAVASFDCAGDLFALAERGLPKIMLVDDSNSVLLLAALSGGAAAASMNAVSAMRIVEAIIAAVIGHHLDVTEGHSVLGVVDRYGPVGRALNVMQDHPERPWTIVELARMSSMSANRFTAVFAEFVGITPMAYLTRWRMALAHHLLCEEPTLLISEIARRVGYSTPFAFSAAFKRQYGTSPSQVRQSGPTDFVSA